MNQRIFWMCTGWLIAGLFFLNHARAQVMYPTPGGVIPTQVLGDYSPWPRETIATPSGATSSATAEATVRTPGGTVKIPVKATADISKAAIAKAAAKRAAASVLGPVGAAATAAQVLNELKDQGYQQCPNSAEWNFRFLCQDNTPAPGHAWAGSFAPTQFIYSSASQACHAAPGDNAAQYWPSYSSDGKSASCLVTLNGNNYTTGYGATRAADATRCPDGSTAVNGECPQKIDAVTPEQLETDLQKKMDQEYEANRRLADALKQDQMEMKDKFPPEHNPIQSDTPVTVTAPPASTPEKTTKVENRTKPDGTTETATTKEKTTVTPKTEGTTIGDSKTTFPSQTITTTTIVNNTTNETTTNTTIVNNEQSEQGSEPEDYTFTDTDMPPVPELYQQKYPDGISGVWRDHKPDIASTQFWQGIKQMFPNFGGGSCPAWSMSFNLGALGNYGTMPFDVPCWIFQAIGLILMTTAAFTARKIIF